MLDCGNSRDCSPGFWTARSSHQCKFASSSLNAIAPLHCSGASPSLLLSNDGAILACNPLVAVKLVLSSARHWLSKLIHPGDTQRETQMVGKSNLMVMRFLWPFCLSLGSVSDVSNAAQSGWAYVVKLCSF